MADYGLLGDLGQGFNALSAGYMQGVRDREDRDMRMQQFNQQQQMAGLQYDMLKQRQVQQNALQKYADAAQAVLMGDYGTAKQLHNELGGNMVEDIRPIDNDNLEITYSDGAQKSVIPKTEYAQVVASRGNPERMINAINTIASNKRMRDLASANIAAKAAEGEKNREFKAGETDKKIAATAEQKDADRKSREAINKLRVSASMLRAAKSAGVSGGGVKGWMMNAEKSYWMRKGMSEADAQDKATENIIINPRSGEKALNAALTSYRDMAKNAHTSEQRKYAEARVAELTEEAVNTYRSKSQGPGSGQPKQSQPSGGVDFAAHGFKQDKATGNWQNPNTGVYFRNNGGKTEAWSNSSKSWVPVK